MDATDLRLDGSNLTVLDATTFLGKKARPFLREKA
jgi:hypothetical protein